MTTKSFPALGGENINGLSHSNSFDIDLSSKFHPASSGKEGGTKETSLSRPHHSAFCSRAHILPRIPPVPTNYLSRRMEARRGNSFPTMLYDIVQNADKQEPSIAHLISWQPHGRCFVVRDQQRLFDEVLNKRYDRNRRWLALPDCCRMMDSSSLPFTAH